MSTMQSLNCCQVVRMEYHPHLTVHGKADPCETTLVDGRCPKGSRHLSIGSSAKRTVRQTDP